MSKWLQRTMFLMFILSGFCGLLYQVIWIRLAYASFGIITPVMSVVISVFMLGLLIGSAWGGPLVKRLITKCRLSAVIFYGLAEFGIGLGAFCVPKLFGLGQHWLLSLGGMNSFSYLLVSAVAIAVALLPWCVLMGFTYPFMMAFVRERDPSVTSSFSFLYLANVIGAMAGTVVTAGVLIELFGFYNTLLIAAVCNFTIAAVGVMLGSGYPIVASAQSSGADASNAQAAAGALPHNAVYVLLFLTGFIAMSMEIIWTRNFTPVLRTVVYSYALLLTTYLFASWIGSYLYRKHFFKSRTFSVRTLLGAVALFSLLPLAVNDPRLPIRGFFTVLCSIMPFCCVLGYLTPQLIDRYSQGSPSVAGRLYAVNTLGCILGPLTASYFFLPLLGVKSSLLFLSLVLMVSYAVYFFRPRTFNRLSIAAAMLFLVFFIGAVVINDTYEEFYHLRLKSEMRRDYAATVTSLGDGVTNKRLLVNGIGMTLLNPITQFMAHLPLAHCENTPSSSLVICFGMGTTFRSLISWGINATAVELIPSVPKAFGYYWPDADSIINNPKAKIVIDDGRRFLMRTDTKYDVITIDPPPPVEAAGSSLLYSTKMYDLIKHRLKDSGILQQWIPDGEWESTQAVARSLAVSFPYVRSFHSIKGWGYHFLASRRPFKKYTAAELVAHMPEKARRDLITWSPEKEPEGYVQEMLKKECPMDSLLSQDNKLLISDEKPFNEYFLLRRWNSGLLAENYARFLRKSSLLK